MNLTERTKNITTYLSSIDGCKVTLANELLATKISVTWRSTIYDTWKNYCDECVSLSQSSIYVYLKTAELAYSNAFTDVDMKIIVAAIGWERFKIGLTKIAKDETVNRNVFIERYKDINLNERVTYKGSDSELESFSFRLPQDAADTLTNALLARGMRLTNSSRSNLSSAMVKLIADLVEDE